VSSTVPCVYDNYFRSSRAARRRARLRRTAVLQSAQSTKSLLQTLVESSFYHSSMVDMNPSAPEFVPASVSADDAVEVDWDSFVIPVGSPRCCTVQITALPPLSAVPPRRDLATQSSECLPDLPTAGATLINANLDIQHISSTATCKYCASELFFRSGSAVDICRDCAWDSFLHSAVQPCRSSPSEVSDFAQMSRSQLVDHILQLSSLLRQREDRLDVLSGMLQDVMEGDGHDDVCQASVAEARPTDTDCQQQFSPDGPAHVSDRAPKSAGDFLAATSLPDLMDRLSQWVDTHRSSKPDVGLLRRTQIGFMVSLEKILPRALILAGREVDPALWTHGNVKSAVHLEQKCHSLLEVLIGVDFEEYIFRQWPELGDAFL